MTEQEELKSITAICALYVLGRYRAEEAMHLIMEVLNGKDGEQ